jgi:hypothetical protein
MTTVQSEPCAYGKAWWLSFIATLLLVGLPLPVFIGIGLYKQASAESIDHNNGRGLIRGSLFGLVALGMCLACLYAWEELSRV